MKCELELDVFDLINLVQAVNMALDVTKKEINDFPNLKNRLNIEIKKFESLLIILNDEYYRLSNA